MDRERIDFIQKYFGVEWPAREVYHGMMNTTVGDEKVVRMILDYIATLDTAAVPA